jgi:very-short-patch-repair endonuclease
MVSRRQLLSAGVSRRAIDVRLERGTLHPVQRGVYAVGHAKLAADGRWMAAVLALGPGALLSHRSAARIWRLIPAASALVEVSGPRNSRPREGIVAHRSRVPEDERSVVDGIPVTTVPRTILDLATVATRRQVERAFNEAEVQRLTDRLSIPDLLDRYPRRSGTAVLRAMLSDDAALSGITRNEFEERFAQLIDAHGLPRPRFNADLAVRGRFFEVDCLWTSARLVVELDGGGVHRTRRAFESDRERDRRLLAEGWRVMRVTWRQLRDAEAEVAADLRAILGSTL